MAALGARLGRRRPFEERFVDDRVVAVRLTTGTTPGCPRHDRVPAEAHQPEHQDDGGDDPEHVRSETQSAQHECEQQYQQDHSHFTLLLPVRRPLDGVPMSSRTTESPGDAPGDAPMNDDDWYGLAPAELCPGADDSRRYAAFDDAPEHWQFRKQEEATRCRQR